MKKLNEEIIKEFRKEFNYNKFAGVFEMSLIENFLLSALSRQLDEVVRIAEKNKKKIPESLKGVMDYDIRCQEGIDFNEGYNQALNEILNKLIRIKKNINPNN